MLPDNEQLSEENMLLRMVHFQCGERNTPNIEYFIQLMPMIYLAPLPKFYSPQKKETVICGERFYCPT